MQRTWVAGLGLLLVALALIAAAFYAPWWGYSLDAETTILGVTTNSSVHQDYHLAEVRMRGEVLGNPFTDETSYEALGDPDLQAVFRNTTLLLWASLALLLLTLAAALLAALGRLSERFVVASGLLATLALLGLAVYFGVALPSALEATMPDLPGGLDALTPEGFWGGDTSTIPTTTLSARWGPTLGWYGVVIALGATVAATVAFVRRSPGG